MMLTEPNISNEDLERISVPTLILAGSNDIVKNNHTRHIARHIPGSELQIQHGEGHAGYVMHSHKIYRILHPFIDKVEHKMTG